MKKEVLAVTVENNKTFNVDLDFPRICPYCKDGGQHLHLHSSALGDDTIYSSFLCSVCERAFIVCYKGNDNIGFRPMWISPNVFANTTFPKNIEDLSPQFCQIYNDAATAELNGITTICGMGYRKALEYLIKDFAIKCNPNDEESIKAAFLGDCISKYIDNEKIKNLSKAASWIGNDETHYVRKHPDYSTEDLKSFIHAALAFIDSELEVLNATKLSKP